MEYLTLACSIGALLISVFQMSREGRSDMKAFLWKVFNWTKRAFGWLSLVLVFCIPISVMTSSVYAFVRFDGGQGPATRHEVVMLFLHFFNLVMYGSLLMVLVVIGIKAYKDLQKEIAEKESPSEEGLSG